MGKAVTIDERVAHLEQEVAENRRRTDALEKTLSGLLADLGVALQLVEAPQEPEPDPLSQKIRDMKAGAAK